MSTQQPSSMHPDEMDIQDVFSLFKRVWYRFLAMVFKGFDFIFKFWWIIALIIIGGIVLGYFSDNEPGHKARLVLKTNYESQSYVYNAVHQFNQNLSEGDVEFMQANGINPSDPEISKIEIEPVIDVIGLMDQMETSNRTLEVIIEELEVEDDAELFSTDRFLRNYKYHILNIDLSGPEQKEAVQAFLNFVNNQPYAKALAAEGKKNFEEQIERNETTIAHIDNVADAYAKSTDAAMSDPENLSFYNNATNLDLREMFDYKSELVEATKVLKNEIVGVSDVAVVLGNIETWKEPSLLDKKYVIYPVMFVFIFLFLVAVRFIYITTRRKVQAADLLD